MLLPNIQYLSWKQFFFNTFKTFSTDVPANEIMGKLQSKIVQTLVKKAAKTIVSSETSARSSSPNGEKIVSAAQSKIGIFLQIILLMSSLIKKETFMYWAKEVRESHPRKQEKM